MHFHKLHYVKSMYGSAKIFISCVFSLSMEEGTNGFLILMGAVGMISIIIIISTPASSTASMWLNFPFVPPAAAAATRG